LENTVSCPYTHWPAGLQESAQDTLIAEEPLAIRVAGKPYAMVMRTPGDEKAHAAGFCLTEGLVENASEIKSIALCDGADSNVVTLTLDADRQRASASVLERRAFISQTSCGLCGKEVVADLYQKIAPMTDKLVIDIGHAYACLENLSIHQPLRKKSRAAHAAVLFDAGFHPLACGEDVGRHNALDKAIGQLFLSGDLNRAVLLVLSSRVSYELVQKAARARIPVIIAVSRPTSLAVALAGRLNMTLACWAKKGGLDIFCGIKRFALPASEENPIEGR
jgi:FdhD protein